MSSQTIPVATLSPLVPGQLIKLSVVLSRYVPVSKSTWYEGQKEGRFPVAVKLGERSRAYKSEDIIRLVEQGVA